MLPTEKRFDSNCITPGTVFMARLHEQLRYFVKEKMTNDPLWSKVKVVLSGHEVSYFLAMLYLVIVIRRNDNVDLVLLKLSTSIF